MNALNVLCAQLTRDLFAIAEFLFDIMPRPSLHVKSSQVFVYLTGMSECRPVHRTMLHNKNSNVRIKNTVMELVWNVKSYDTNMCFYITCV